MRLYEQITVETAKKRFDKGLPVMASAHPLGASRFMPPYRMSTNYRNFERFADKMNYFYSVQDIET